jgi:hypothetical protein
MASKTVPVVCDLNGGTISAEEILSQEKLLHIAANPWSSFLNWAIGFWSSIF